MKKLNFIIGKRQIMISTLLLILAVAAYLNWQFATNEQSISVMDVLNPKKTQNSPQSVGLNAAANDESNYGEAELVSNKIQADSAEDKNQNDIQTDYFTQAKLQKEASRAETGEELQKTQSMPNISQETKEEAQRQYLKLTATAQQEQTIDSQVKAEGFSDCLSYISNNDTKNEDSNDTTVKVVVKTENQMTQAQAATIKDIVVGVTNAKAKNIVVTPVA